MRGDGFNDAEEECDDGNVETEVCAYGELTARCAQRIVRIKQARSDSVAMGHWIWKRTVMTAIQHLKRVPVRSSVRCMTRPVTGYLEQPRVCGDGTLDAEEECDEGNIDNRSL